MSFAAPALPLACQGCDETSRDTWLQCARQSVLLAALQSQMERGQRLHLQCRHGLCPPVLGLGHRYAGALHGRPQVCLQLLRHLHLQPTRARVVFHHGQCCSWGQVSAISQRPPNCAGVSACNVEGRLPASQLEQQGREGKPRNIRGFPASSLHNRASKSHVAPCAAFHWSPHRRTQT